jgi:hypothetical protein
MQALVIGLVLTTLLLRLWPPGERQTSDAAWQQVQRKQETA